MLIFIVVVFIICHSIRSIINTYEFIQLYLYGEMKYWPSWIQTLVFLNHFALVVNSSINILIYTVKDEKFRNVMLKTLGLTRYVKADFVFELHMRMYRMCEVRTYPLCTIFTILPTL